MLSWKCYKLDFLFVKYFLSPFIFVKNCEKYFDEFKIFKIFYWLLLIPSANSISFKLYTTMDENLYEDYFSYLLQSKFERRVSLYISIIVLIVGPPMLFSIVWFENFGSDKKRTLLNRLVAMNCWTGNKTRLLFLRLS